MKIFEELGTSQGLQPFALSKIAIALSIRFGPLSDKDFSADTEGLELNRQTIFGEYEGLFKALLSMEKKVYLSDEEFFPLWSKHIWIVAPNYYKTNPDTECTFIQTF